MISPRALQLRTTFVHDLNVAGIIATEHVGTNDNLADHLTKCLGRLKLDAAMTATGMTISTGHPDGTDAHPAQPADSDPAAPAT